MNPTASNQNAKPDRIGVRRVRRVAAAGLGWHRYQHSTNPPPPTQGPENPLTKLMRQQCTFNMMAMQMTYMMYSQGDADTLLPLLSSYADSTNQQLREAAVLAKKQVTEHPLVKKKLGVQPFMSGRPPASLPPPQRETDSATHGNK